MGRHWLTALANLERSLPGRIAVSLTTWRIYAPPRRGPRDTAATWIVPTDRMPPFFDREAGTIIQVQAFNAARLLLVNMSMAFAET